MDQDSANFLSQKQTSNQMLRYRKQSIFEQQFFTPIQSPNLSYIEENSGLNDSINNALDFSNINIEEEINKIEKCIQEEKQEDKKILIICLGGTISMVKSEEGLVVKKGAMQELMKQYYHMYDPDYVKDHGKGEWYITPKSVYGRRTWYQFHEIDKPIDSSNMESEIFIDIVKIIENNYHKYDGFLVIHGTDTMSYTASVLSFLLENLGKTVILTGSMIPLCEEENDAYNNLICSLLIIGHFTFQEVTIFMNDKLIRGNRAKKTSSEGIDAFDSPMIPALAYFCQEKNGILVLNKEIVYDNTQDNMPFKAHKLLCEDIIVIQINPCLNLRSIKNQVNDPDIKGIILETYGAGNIPSNKPELINILKSAVERGVLVVNISQCFYSTVSPIYQTGFVLNQIGVVFAQDMTFETVLCKLQYILSKDNLSMEERKQYMTRSIRGELTEQHQEIKQRRKKKEDTIKIQQQKRASLVFPDQENQLKPITMEINNALESTQLNENNTSVEENNEQNTEQQQQQQQQSKDEEKENSIQVEDKENNINNSNSNNKNQLGKTSSQNSLNDKKIDVDVDLLDDNDLKDLLVSMQDNRNQLLENVKQEKIKPVRKTTREHKKLQILNNNQQNDKIKEKNTIEF